MPRIKIDGISYKKDKNGNIVSNMGEDAEYVFNVMAPAMGQIIDEIHAMEGKIDTLAQAFNAESVDVFLRNEFAKVLATSKDTAELKNALDMLASSVSSLMESKKACFDMHSYTEGLKQEHIEIASLLQSLSNFILEQRASFNSSILNNVSSAEDIPYFKFAASVKMAKVSYIIERSDDAPTSVNEFGELTVYYDEKNDQWALSVSKTNDAGVTFAIDTATGQVSYTSTNYVGANYQGSLRATLVRLINK